MENVDRRTLLQLAAAASIAYPATRLLSKPVDPLSPAVPFATDLDVVNARSAALLRQLRFGLAYDGRSMNFALRVDPQPSIDLAKQLVPLGKVISDQKTTIDLYISDKTQRYTQFSHASAAAAEISDEHRQALAKDIGLWKTAGVDLENLDRQIIARIEELNLAQEEFKRAVENSWGQVSCGFAQICVCVASIVAAYVGASGLVAAVGEAVTDVEDISLEIASIAKIVKDIKAVEGSYEKIRDAYNKIKTALDASGKGALIFVPASDLQARVNDVVGSVNGVRGVSGAIKDRYITAIWDYVAATQARNQQIILMEALATDALQHAAAMDEYAKRAADLHDMANADAVPDLAKATHNLDAIFWNYLRRARDFLFEVNRSLDYYMLRSHAPDKALSSTDLGHLAEAAAAGAVTLQRYKNERPSSPQKYGGAGEPELKVAALVPPTHLPIAGDALLISFDVDAVSSDLREVYADSAKIYVDGVQLQSGKLTIAGASRFTSFSGEKLVYILKQETFVIAKDWIPLGSTQEASSPYLGLSPFSDWLIKGIPLSKISRAKKTKTPLKVEIAFMGTFRATT